MQADGPKIRRLRELAGFRLRRFAEAAGLSPAHLSRIERGERHPTPEVLARIASGLGREITEIEIPRQEQSHEQDGRRPAVHDDQGSG
ncbi:helix-turn-helix transcriptional regulator [Streptomyces sp. DSM 44917]|uniref:Helix-turn-helix transcriptional regulator n=1 Tax=Streptomyces boetiae TaxID=3075541 RepID=A0ABU2L5J4_9ACTN|nr:helix-turn-helix transcriptional regulator [Streptomyces sp. DSM 44917]MDT0306830.1 helix-turn-helix transcriptional regulator [Streptomyces sp. DSM 44917]